MTIILTNVATGKTGEFKHKGDASYTVGCTCRTLNNMILSGKEHKGWTATDKIEELCKDISEHNKKSYSRKAKTVYNYTTGQEYKSITACSKVVGLHPSNVAKAIAQGRPLKGNLLSLTAPASNPQLELEIPEFTEKPIIIEEKHSLNIESVSETLGLSTATVLDYIKDNHLDDEDFKPQTVVIDCNVSLEGFGKLYLALKAKKSKRSKVSIA